MKITELNEMEFRYVCIRLDSHTERYENTNFTELLKYIGKHYPINDRNPIGCAYVKIRKETDRLLCVSWGHNWKLRTSKNEVKSIRLAKYCLFEDRKNHYYIKIPYKISYIFTAVINIIAELSKEYPLPAELKDCVGKAYGFSFYSLHTSEYMKEYNKEFKRDSYISENKKNPAKLFNVFDAPASVFRHLFP